MTLALTDPRVRGAIPAYRDLPGRQATPDHKVPSGRQALRDRKGFRVFRERKGPPVRAAQQAPLAF